MPHPIEERDEEATHISLPEEEVEIRPLQSGDDPSAFRSLNEEWIARYFTLEEKDREVLEHPDQHILSKGGQVFMLFVNGNAAGCVALIPTGGDVYELSKMAVSPRMRGRGLGRRLLEHSIAEARRMGAKSLFLGSNSRLQDAVHLYESVGFKHIEADRIPRLGYVRANVFMELPLMNVQRFAAFSKGESGGNPAGIILCERLPDAATMQTIAAEVGYSETAFAARDGQGWRVRYFSPETEVPFCGHATLALGAALSRTYGSGVYALSLNATSITVEGHVEGDSLSAALQSPATHTEAIPPQLLDEALSLFGYSLHDLDQRIPPAIACAGARHLILALKTRESLQRMNYDLAAGRNFMLRAGLITVMFVFSETPQRFHSRNAFASGGVLEDPATGAATAAFAGYLRELGWPHDGAIDLIQGEDMGCPSLLRAEIPPKPGSSIRVSGSVRIIAG